MPELPAVVVFKDGGYFTYDGEYFAFFLKLLPLFSSFGNSNHVSSAFCSRCSPLIFPTAPTRLGVLAHHKAPGVLPRLYVCGGFSDVVVAGLYIADLGARTAVLSGREKPRIKKRNLCWVCFIFTCQQLSGSQCLSQSRCSFPNNILRF